MSFGDSARGLKEVRRLTGHILETSCDEHHRGSIRNRGRILVRWNRWTTNKQYLLLRPIHVTTTSLLRHELQLSLSEVLIVQSSRVCIEEIVWLSRADGPYDFHQQGENTCKLSDRWNSDLCYINEM